MGSTRIPMSLKFDDSTDFYNEFICDMRENKTLATFIVDILRAYYEDDEVRERVNVLLNVYDPMTEIKKQIERAKLEHNKTVMATTMLHNHVKTATEELKTEVTNNDHLTPALPDPKIINRLESLEKSLPSIEEKLNLLISSMTQNKNNTDKPITMHTNIQQTETVSQPTNVVSIEAPVQNTLDNQFTTNPIVQVQQTEEENIAPKIEQPIISQHQQPKVEENIQVQHIVGNKNAPVITFGDTEEEEKPNNKPSSFGKALKSLKK